MYDYTIDYNEQMLNYYPDVIKAIREFQVLINTQSLEVEKMHEELTKALTNAYVTDCDVDTISKWEQFLGITPMAGESLNDRKATVLARLYAPEKLNADTIEKTVRIFVGKPGVGTQAAKSYFTPDDSTIHVLIIPPEDNRQFKFENVEQELSKKIPAHLTFAVERNYYTWLQTNTNYSRWRTVKTTFSSWNDVLLRVSL